MNDQHPLWVFHQANRPPLSTGCGPSGAPQWDQRGPGFPRLVHGRIDIGAFEVQTTPIASLVGRDPGTGEWWTALSNGTNGFTNVAAAAWDPSATWVDVQTGDFNGDRFTDIVGRDLRSGQWWVGLSDGHGHFSTSLFLSRCGQFATQKPRGQTTPTWIVEQLLEGKPSEVVELYDRFAELVQNGEPTKALTFPPKLSK
jgi:hypothetical protein